MAIFYHLDEIFERIAPEPFKRYMRVVFDHHIVENSPISLGYFRLEPGQFGPKHTHNNEVEIYITIKGKGKVNVGNEVVEMTPGTIIYVQPKIEHQTFNTGESDLEFYGVFSPSVDFTEMRSWPYISKSNG